MKKSHKLSIFFCTRTFESEAVFLPKAPNSLEVRGVSMACSSMVKDIFLLKAFEAGADAVTVWVCPEGKCRHVEGNLRARKRVERVKALLEAIGFNGRRLTFFNLIPGDLASASDILEGIVATFNIIDGGPSKVSGCCFPGNAALKIQSPFGSNHSIQTDFR
ncbi:MAG: hypothetical protein COS92_05915 [Desulfobacterales bacterium CG07_land_8_20_14_0_80_52_14]|nr:MAG: hypothetical protein COX20_07980 [Desulfobacterales bacterium CG23_combo_of_CG06-09_8_20_14_all_52_9]PIU49567.1 MAG: hypothetical protein COS92_05915 [Desulfobacterales bacterium CG07_land_8_20_14_0_80_52_14]